MATFVRSNTYEDTLEKAKRKYSSWGMFVISRYTFFDDEFWIADSTTGINVNPKYDEVWEKKPVGKKFCWVCTLKPEWKGVVK